MTKKQSKCLTRYTKENGVGLTRQKNGNAGDMGTTILLSGRENFPTLIRKMRNSTRLSSTATRISQTTRWMRIMCASVRWHGDFACAVVIRGHGLRVVGNYLRHALTPSAEAHTGTSPVPRGSYRAQSRSD